MFKSESASDRGSIIFLRTIAITRKLTVCAGSCAKISSTYVLLALSLSTGINAGQVRGPVQLIEPIVPQEITITRMAATNEAEKKRRTEGSEKGDDKHIVPYALYRAHGFVSAKIS
jgi:CRISPR/Cas system type I-B associated protein Csh2 (Cas7 group RAMP superfamily)